MPETNEMRQKLRPTFDAHVHIWERLWEDFIVGTARSGRFDQQQLISGLMERHGVQRACVIAACNEENLNNNEFVAEICRRNPEGFVMLSEIAPASDRREELLDKTLQSWPALGFRYIASREDRPVRWLDVEHEQFWERVDSNELFVSLNLSPTQAAELEPLVKRYSRTKWLLDHMGRPSNMAEYRGVLDLSKYLNVFVKISGFYAFTARSSEYPYLDLARFIKMLKEAFGSKRLLWGSDAPPVLDFSSYEQSYACLLREEMGLSVDDLIWIFGKTAETLFVSRSKPVASLQIA
jgi:predicted TIM-barrel fold metal-dependent hydrolase